MLELWEQHNARKPGSGFVTRFDVTKEFLDEYETHVVGAKHHEEYWIPVKELEAFNAAIVGEIRVVAEFRKADAKGG